MKVSASSIWSSVKKIKENSPVIHNITNYVVMNNTANALLAIGASPVMAHAEEEVEEMVNIAGALVINIGTLSPHWIRAMLLAVEQAKKMNIPIILDPVGAGATAYRTNTARELIQEAPPAIIRGNASEIMALTEKDAKTKGVESTASSHSTVDIARRLNRTYGSVICVSGETDYIVYGDDVTKVINGHPMMTKVTGMGCIATAICGAFAAVNETFAEATVQAMAVMGMAGEIAVKDAAGPGMLQVRFLDALYGLSENDIKNYLRLEG
ncbi:MAG: hydroxyethylthiazole kinase [Syntrophales bacterium]